MDLEQVVATCQSKGAIVVAGDFNAHIDYDADGSIVGGNPHGVCLAESLDLVTSSLYPVSLTEMVQGTCDHYTYSSSGHCTTVDYIMASPSLSDVITRCSISNIDSSVSDRLAL